MTQSGIGHVFDSRSVLATTLSPCSRLQEGAEPAQRQARADRKSARMQRYYAGLLMTFEWLIEVPRTLGPSWRVMARPEGKRCLLIASRCALAL